MIYYNTVNNLLIKTLITLMESSMFESFHLGTNSLYNKLICYRIEKGITQQGLGRNFGVNDSTIERIEKRSNNISGT